MPGTRKVVTEAIFSMSSSSTESTKRAQLTHWDFGPVSSILVSTNFSLFMDNLLRIVFFVDDIYVFLPIVLYSSYNWESVYEAKHSGYYRPFSCWRPLWNVSGRLASSLIKSVELKICSLPTTCSITCYVWLLRLLSTRPASRPATHYAPLLAPYYTPSASQADAHGFILVFHAFLSLKAALLSLPEQMITHHNQEVSLQLTTRWFQLGSLLYRSRLPRLAACTAA